MKTETFDSLASLADLDFAKDLVGRTLRITVDGASWERTRGSKGVSKSDLLDLYYYLGLTRAVDLEMVKLSRKGLALGKSPRCLGNEATAVGAAICLRPEEWSTLAIRDLGVFLVRGIPISQILAQACGRSGGLTGGWDGNMHMGSRAAHIAGLVSHLGTLLCTATGCAFAEVYRDTGNAVLAFTGDGATSTGNFHEALNIASVLRLPLVVVIENNQWAFGTPNRLQFATPTLALRALAYGPNVEGCLVDGTDVLAVRDAVSSALERARTQRRITIIEAVTMRMDGHTLSDPFTRYVPADQLAVWQKKDPIALFSDVLLSSGSVDNNELRDIDDRIKVEVLEAALLAEASPPPGANNLTAKVFSQTPAHPVAMTAPTGGKETTYHKAIHDALDEELMRNPDLFLIGEDIGVSDGAFKITEGLSRKYDGLNWSDSWNDATAFTQRRIIDAPLGESGFCGLAIGAAISGLSAIVEFQYADFSADAFKMLANYAATETVRGMGPLPIVFRLPSGWAPSTSIYHSVNPESWYGSTPGLKIVAPATAFDAKGLLKAAIRDGNPVLFLEYKGIYRLRPDSLPKELRLPVPVEDYVVPIGKARVVKEGIDLTVITYGSQLHRVCDAVARVEKERKTSIEIIDLRSLVPMDTACIETTARKTGKVLVTCEAPRTGCFGNTIVTEVMRSSFDYLDAPVQLLAAADTPVPFAPSLEAAHLPTTEKVVEALHKLLDY